MSSEAFDYSRDAFALAEDWTGCQVPTRSRARNFHIWPRRGWAGFVSAFCPDLLSRWKVAAGPPLAGRVAENLLPGTIRRRRPVCAQTGANKPAVSLARCSLWPRARITRPRSRGIARRFWFCGRLSHTHPRTTRAYRFVVSISGLRLCIANRIEPAIH